MLSEKEVAVRFLLSCLVGVVRVYAFCSDSCIMTQMFCILMQDSHCEVSCAEARHTCTYQEKMTIFLVCTTVSIFISLLFDFGDFRETASLHYPDSQPSRPRLSIVEDEKASSHVEECLVCKENRRIYAAMPCSHLVVCATCKRKLKTSRCPVCNAESEWARIFY